MSSDLFGILTDMKLLYWVCFFKSKCYLSFLDHHGEQLKVSQMALCLELHISYSRKGQSIVTEVNNLTLRHAIIFMEA